MTNKRQTAVAIIPLYYVMEQQTIECAHCRASRSTVLLLGAHPMSDGPTPNTTVNLIPVKPGATLWDIPIRDRLLKYTTAACPTCISTITRAKTPVVSVPTGGSNFSPPRKEPKPTNLYQTTKDLLL